MRVLLVGPYPFDPAVIDSGVKSSFVYLVGGLGEVSGLEPQVISFVPGLERPVRSTRDGVPIDYLPSPRRLAYLSRHALERRRLAAVLRDRRPDLVHAQDTLGSGYTSLKAAGGVPVLVTVHGIVREELKHLPRGLERVRTRVLATSLERYCIRNASYLVASTGYPERYFGNEIKGRIAQIDNPISDEFFAITPDPDPGGILYAGAVIPRKRLLDLVEAMPSIVQHVPGARLRVAGGEPDLSYATLVRARVRELGLESGVDFLGNLTREDLLAELARASVFVLPSNQETSPLAIGEAMSASLPVVATRVGGVPDLVDEGVTGHVVDVGDVAALAAAVATFLAPERQAAAGAAGRARAETRFRGAVVARRFRDLYEQIREEAAPA